MRASGFLAAQGVEAVVVEVDEERGGRGRGDGRDDQCGEEDARDAAKARAARAAALFLLRGALRARLDRGDRRDEREEREGIHKVSRRHAEAPDEPAAERRADEPGR